MTLNKKDRAQRDLFLKIDGVEWKGKNLLRLRRRVNFKEDIARFEAAIIQLGYSLNTSIFGGSKHIEFNIEPPKHPPTDWKYWYLPCEWFVEISTKEYLVDITMIFTWVDSRCLRNGYGGTNEWKRDICRYWKIPMTGSLSYLDPVDSWWDCDELKPKIKKL